MSWFSNLFSGKRIKQLENKITQLERHNIELEETLAEYHEIIEAGWDYPDVTWKLPKSRDIIPRADIKKQLSEQGKYRLVIENLPDFLIADVADTLSEDPFFGVGHNLILQKLPQPYAPYRYEDLTVGDTAVYQVGTRLISHQIVKIEQDDLGRKYTFRGRNTGANDPYIVRDANIKYLINVVAF